MEALEKLKVLWALGPSSVARVGSYKALLKSGLHPVQRIRAESPLGPFFRAVKQPERWLPSPNTTWKDRLRYFGWLDESLPPGGTPDWHRSPFAEGARGNADVDWWTLPDFRSGEDIKGFWELSRFDWVVALATCAAHGDAEALDQLNAWLADWVLRNPPYHGLNWKCGQEASIRVLHLVLAAMILHQDEAPEAGLGGLLELHLRRIAPTMSYAIGQQNNHGTSEAAAMFTGGSLLEGLHEMGARWARTGRRRLEERASSLIETDGSFSQYSVTYHRLMLDTYSLAEVWRRRRALPPFSDAMMARLRSAAHWLRQFVDPVTGDAPNIGANDGARLMPLTDSDYRDFRPSVQLAKSLFAGIRAISASGPWDDALHWLGLSEPVEVAPALASESLNRGGYHVLRRGSVTAYMHYPRFRFRPSQADALHLDLWVAGRNILRDAGTYSYNASAEDLAYFAGTASHNTVTFDGRDQMPRLGRFLYGAWLQAEDVEMVNEEDGEVSAAAGYTDWRGARHHRHVSMKDGILVCTDRLGGEAEKAVLRWRLAPGRWRLDGNEVTDGVTKLKVSGDFSDVAARLVEGWESRYYLQKIRLPVFEVRCNGSAKLVTEIHF